MAKVIDWNPFGPWRNGPSYAELFDGRVWEMARGEDFDVTPETVARHIQAEFNRLHGQLMVKVEGDIVRVQHVSGVAAKLEG